MAKRTKTTTGPKRNPNRLVIPNDPTKRVALGHEYGWGRSTDVHRDKRQRRQKARLRKELRDY